MVRYCYILHNAILMMIKIFCLFKNKLYTLDTPEQNTTYLLNSTSNQITGTTPLLTKSISSGIPMVVNGPSYTVMMYAIIALAGVFVVICGVFVGTYVYKHCVKQPPTTSDKELVQFSNPKEYNSLSIPFQEQSDHCSDPTYLEPVTDTRSQYNEINLNDMEQIDFAG